MAKCVKINLILKSEDNKKMPIYIRTAKKNDLTKIMVIIDEAKQLLKDDGNPQWQGGHPNQEILANDIAENQAYCLMVDHEVAGIAILLTRPEPTYKSIVGAWRNDYEKYATIHRLAISTKFRDHHLAKFFISNLISRGMMLGIHNFRIDTHKANKRMQALIKHSGFKYCGIVQIDQTENGARNAYELNL